MSKVEATESKSKKSDLARGPSVHWADPDDDCLIIGLDTKDGPEHPLYDPRIHMTLTEPEIRNVEFHGIVTPVKARRGKSGKLEIIEGRQRVRKARIVKQRQLKRGEETIRVPVLIEKSNDDAHLFSLSRVGNVGRIDGPMTTAKNVQKYLSLGRSITEAADTFGVTEQTIRNYQTMLDLDPAVIDAMIKEEISTTAALQLASLPKADQQATLEEIKEEQKDTGKRATVERVKEKVAEKTGKASNSPKDKIKRATNLLIKFAAKPAGEKTKEEMAGTLERLCRVLTGAGLDKLVEDDE